MGGTHQLPTAYELAGGRSVHLIPNAEHTYVHSGRPAVWATRMNVCMFGVWYKVNRPTSGEFVSGWELMGASHLNFVSKFHWTCQTRPSRVSNLTTVYTLLVLNSRKGTAMFCCGGTG